MKSRILFIALSFLLLTSCGNNKEIIRNETVRIEKEIIHDTIFQTVADSSSFKALLKCDSSGNIYIVHSVSSSGKNMKAPEVTIRDNILNIDCKAEAQKLFFQWKEKYKSDTKTSIRTIEVERKLTPWQLTQIWLGRILILLVIIACAALIAHYRHKK